MDNIDIENLIADGVLDLKALFDNEHWKTEEVAASFIECCFGLDGNQPGKVEVRVEVATQYGIVAYRVADDGDTCEDLYLDLDEAREAAKEWADDNDETPDLDEQIDGILESSYFGEEATA